MAQLPPILLLDDDPDDIFILKRLLVKAGVDNKTISFEDPAAAVEYLAAEIRNPRSLFIPCCVFSDLNMPRMDGIEFVQWIRSQPVLRALPVVIVSSSEDPADSARALAAGATQFLLKYPKASALKKVVEQAGGNGR